MNQEFLKFNRFLAEEEDMNTFMQVRTKEEEEPVDKKKQKKIDKYREEKEKVCPRCGKNEGECKCPTEDFYSTINAYRIPKGEEVSVKEMKNISSFERFSVDEDYQHDTDFTHEYDYSPAEWKRWEEKNRHKYEFHHVKQDLYWDVYDKKGTHLFTYNYDEGKIYTDEPLNFFES